MTLHPCDLLGRDFTFNRVARPGILRSRITVTAFDPSKGWRLASRLHGTAWVPAAMFQRLLADGRAGGRMKLLPGLSFSWKRAVGLSALKGRISRRVGIPLTASGRQRKLGRMLLRAILGGRS